MSGRIICPNSLLRWKILLILISSVLQIYSKTQIANAQEYPGCFLIDHAHRVVNLDGVCKDQQNKEPEEPPPIVRGIALIKLMLAEGYIKGKMTNTTDKVVDIKTITLQLEDKTTGDVVTNITFKIPGTLAPHQSREINEIVDKTLDLGGRNGSQLTVIFIDWQ